MTTVPFRYFVVASLLLGVGCLGSGEGGAGDGGGAAGTRTNDPGVDGGGAERPDVFGGGGGPARDASSTPGTGGASGGGGVDGDAGGTDGTGGSQAEPVCDAVDSDGFFPDCSACPSSDCDSISVNGQTRRACGCSGGCPCGLGCGSYEIGPGVSVGGICVR